MEGIKNIKHNNLISGCLCALTAEAIFGLSYVFTKNATSDASAFSLLGWRFFIAVIVMSILVAAGIIKVNLRGKKLKPLIAVAIFNPVAYLAGETIGINHTTASESGVFLACIPVASLIASTLILHKKPRKIQVAGILITLLGVLVTVLAVGASSSLSLIGYLSLFIGVICYALYSVYVDKASEFSGVEITYVMLIAGAGVFILLAIIEGGLKGNMGDVLSLPLVNKGFLAAILFQGIVCSAIAFFLSNVAIAKIGVNRTASFIGVSTVVSILAGVVILKESISIYQIIGAMIIVAGVYTANKKSKGEEEKTGTYMEVEEKLKDR